MRFFWAITSISATASIAFSATPPGNSGDVATAIDRGVRYLAKDAQAWKTTRKCVSCHHASLVIWSMREAKDHGSAVDDAVLAELTKWVAESGDGKVGLARPASAPKAANSKAIHLALGLSTNSHPDAVSQTGLKTLLKTIQADQIENGSWSAWPETRPPIFGTSNETLTELATLALLPAANQGDAAAQTACDKAVKWLTATKAERDPQSVALRLLLWRQLNRPMTECQPLIDQIRENQNTDGGWSQTTQMKSDAWATGQALYALAIAGLKGSDPSVSRGQRFLIKTQRDDGSWPMTSRPVKSGGEGSKNLNPITCAGSAWAIIGLSRSR